MEPEEHVGRVESYQPETQAANVHVDAGHLEMGDIVHFQGTDADFEEAVTSLRRDRQPVQEAHEGEDVEIWVRHPVSEGTEVRRVRDPYEEDQAEMLGRFFGRTGPTGEGAGQGETI
jgi:translation elongation factor EF-1alpha